MYALKKSKQQYVLDPGGPFWHGSSLILAWIINQNNYEVWNEMIYPFPNFNGATVEVWEWIIIISHTLIACDCLFRLRLCMVCVRNQITDPHLSWKLISSPLLHKAACLTIVRLKVVTLKGESVRHFRHVIVIFNILSAGTSFTDMD